MRLYRITLETHHPFRQFYRYAKAQSIEEAWGIARQRGAEYNSKVRKNPCVVYGVKFCEALS